MERDSYTWEGDFFLQGEIEITKGHFKEVECGFGILNLEVDVAIKDLNVLDELASDGSSLDLVDLAMKRSLASSIVWEVSRFKESILPQKARALWLEEGDSHSKYFYKVVNLRVRWNLILGLNTLNGWIDKVELVKEEVKSHFDTRFAESLPSRPHLDGIEFNSISEEEAFTEDEVWDVITNCDGDKSLVPDGFTVRF